jgi:hypothetical protein
MFRHSSSHSVVHGLKGGDCGFGVSMRKYILDEQRYRIQRMSETDSDVSDTDEERGLFRSAADMVLDGVGTGLMALFDGM